MKEETKALIKEMSIGVLAVWRPDCSRQLGVFCTVVAPSGTALLVQL